MTTNKNKSSSFLNQILTGVIVALATTCALWLFGVLKKIPDHISIPKGTIVAWHPGHEIPSGWSVCDGTNGTPNLENKFILGVTEVAESGKSGGQDTHSHVSSIENNAKRSNNTRGENSDAAHYDHNHVISIKDSSNMPPHIQLIYIMKK